MMTPIDFHLVLDALDYKDWNFHLDYDEGRPWLQVFFMAEDIEEPGRFNFQYGRKWFLSPHMTRSEVVQTALKAVLTAEEHEARERFRYRGKAIFGPHLDVDILHDMADKVEVRAGI